MANKILPVADALKQLYEALGGDDPEVLELSTNTELIQEIAKVAPSGGSGLPEVTDVDEGKVLTVDSSGEWAAEMPSSNSGYLGSFLGESPESLQITFNEIKNMVISGAIPWFTLNVGSEAEPDVDIFTLQWFGYANDVYSCKFGCYLMGDNEDYVNVDPDEDLILD